MVQRQATFNYRSHPNAIMALRRLLSRLQVAGACERALLVSRIPHLTSIARIITEVVESRKILVPRRYGQEFIGLLHENGIVRLQNYLSSQAEMLAAIISDAELLLTITTYFQKVLNGYARKDTYRTLKSEESREGHFSEAMLANIPDRSPTSSATGRDPSTHVELLQTVLDAVRQLSSRDQKIVQDKLKDVPALQTASELGLTLGSFHVECSRLYKRIRSVLPPDLL